MSCLFIVMGCPNLSLTNVMSRRNIESIAVSSTISTDSAVGHAAISVPGVESGSLYFAVSGRGAFARSLAMPFGAAIETQVHAVC
jgi:hypothetical protein